MKRHATITCLAVLLLGGAALAQSAAPLVSTPLPVASNAGSGNFWIGSGVSGDFWSDQYEAVYPPASSRYVAWNIASAPRTALTLFWQATDSDYDELFEGGNPVNVPGTYTLQVNATGGTKPPSLGWVTLVSVSRNELGNAHFALPDLTPYAWFRMNVTASAPNNGGNGQCHWQAGLHATATSERICAWGDSITAGWSDVNPAVNGNTGVNCVQELLAEVVPGHTPILSDCGLLGKNSVDANTYLPTLLAKNDSPYVICAFGTNDCDPNLTTQQAVSQFTTNMTAVLQGLVNAGRIPIVPTIPWIQQSAWLGGNGWDPAKVAPLNQVVTGTLWQIPGVQAGPDLYSLFLNHSSWFNPQDVHPNDLGRQKERQAWATNLQAIVYP